MTKTFTLCFFFIVSMFHTFSKGNFRLVEINPSLLDNSSSKINTADFRFENIDYLIIQPIVNSESYLKENGFSIETYVGDGYYSVSCDASKTKTLLQSIQLNKIGYLSPELKIDEFLELTNSDLPVTVLYAASLNDSELSRIAQKTGINIIKNDKKHHHFSAYINQKQLSDLARYPFIYFITKYYPTKNPLIYDGSLMIGANQIQEPQPFGYNLKGDGVNVGIWDEGAVGYNINLPTHKNIVIDKEYNSLAYMYHPTEVAGCIGGKGNLLQRLKGIAPNCTMYYWDVLNDIVQEVETGKSTYAIDISNHSYNFAACNCFQSGLYIPEAADLDKLVYDNPTLLPVVAVGNTAASNCAVASDTFNSVDIGFQGCKNAITVGWLFTNERIVENSGRGPTEDGRIKPELVAKGFQVTSLLPDNGIGAVYGSSYSAPQVSGLSALLYQKYIQEFSTTPNASLIKAILFNTARDLGNVGPDYIYGFGIPDANRAVKTINENLFIEDNVNQSAVNIHPFTVSGAITQLKVTLSWTDKEGSPIASKSLVNNLDLKLVTPNGDTVLPWKLNPAIPKNPALRGIDNVNTNEQETIDNPIAGTYKIVVKGTSVPFGPQHYAVAYYNQERKIEITHPNGGEIIDAGSSTTIRWYTNGIDSLVKIEFSADNGGAWQTVATNQPTSVHTFTWTTPILSSNQCLVKISSGNNVAISAAPFTIATQIFYPSINHTVCDRTVKINWPAVTDATGYKVYLFVDSVWVLAGQTNLLTFTINNLINGKSYMYSISNINNGVESNRSLANTFMPLRNVCTTLNDVGVYSMDKPFSGRRSTSSQLSNSTKLSFIIKNYGTATQNSISVSYKLNGGPTQTALLSDVLTANDTSIIKFSINEAMFPIGNYNVVAWTSLPGDNNTKNDTLYYTIRQLANAPVVLPISESFENVNQQLSSYTFGVIGLDYADYNPENGGRLRTNEGKLFANSGEKALTLDVYNGAPAKKNELFFTYNLSGYVDSLVFLDFSYMNRSEPDSNDIIYARGDDSKPWIRIYDLFTNKGIPGKYKNVKEINLYQKLKVESGQNFSASTQIRIVQTGIKNATSPDANGGYTFDDFKLYNAGRDVSVAEVSIKKANCTKTFTPQPVKIKIKNNSSQTITSLPVSYKVDGNTVVNEVVAATINAKDSFTYTFNTLFNYSDAGAYTLKAWASNPGDNYRLNDTGTVSVFVMPTIDSFPYYNDFETNNGNLFSEGTNNSWIWSTPLKYYMNNAAQDSKAWTTGVKKGYNFNEDSYLYMGCMDFSSLTKDPLISFNFISLMQTQSDSAYAEYSTDGTNWNRLGCYNCGLNWYNGYQNKPYWDGALFPWQVAHYAVPLSTLADSGNFMYRIHLLSDDFAVSDGIGIDDIHILKDYEEIATTDSVYVSQISTGNGWIEFYRNGKLVAELNDDNKNLGNVVLGYEANTNKNKVLNNVNIFPRNWVFKPQNSSLGNYKVRLYILNTEYTGFVTNEDSINRMGDIGLLRYYGLNTNLNIFDNHVKSYYKYFSPAEIQFYPYNGGYYVEFTTDTLSEFYLLSTKQDADAIQNINLIDFAAQKINDDVYLEWKTTREVNSKEFIIQYSFDAATFIDVDTVPAGNFSSNTTLYNYLHQLNATSGIYYYRIKIIDNTNRFSYSLIDSVYFATNVGVKQNSILVRAYISENDINIEFKNKLQSPSVVYIYNSLGQLEFSKSIILSNGINPLGITNFSSWSNGAYYLQIQSGEHSYYSKLMRQQ